MAESSKSTKKMPKTYEEAMKSLEGIVSRLESGDESLEESLKLYEEGAKLSAFCYEKLQKAEQKIKDFSKLNKSEVADDTAVE